MAAKALKQHLRQGQVYRRGDLAQFTSSLDRDLQQLVEQGYLQRLQHGLYYRPQESKFGSVPPDLDKLVCKFLKTDDFVLLSYSDFNRLGLGLTQLYREYVVFNNKRHGRFELAGQTVFFKNRNGFPSEVSPEFLMVAFLNEQEHLAEKPYSPLSLKAAVASLDRRRLHKLANDFGKVRTRKVLNQTLQGLAKAA